MPTAKTRRLQSHSYVIHIILKLRNGKSIEHEIRSENVLFSVEFGVIIG